MRVVTTGASGFIGSHIVDKLLELGHTPVIIDNLSSNVDFTRPGVEVHRSSIGRDTITKALAGCDAIIHAAAYADLRDNWKSHDQRQRLVDDNVNATIAILEVMPKVPIVMLSTAATYGAQTKDGPVVETDATPETMQSPYAASKFAAEAFIASYAYAKGHPWYCARLVNVVGARSTHGVIGDFVRMMRKNGHIHAADNGAQRKSWVHVDDVAGATIKMVTENVIPSGVYTVTSDARISWWDIVTAMGVRHSEVTYNDQAGGAIGDPVDLHTSGEKLARWYTCDRKVEDGIRSALDYMGWE